MKQYKLRKFTEEDKELLFNWANEEEVRKNSFQSDYIDWNIHQIWFYKQLKKKDSSIYIYCENEEPIGQIRLEYKGNYAEIHYSIEKKYRGQGHGERMLLLAEEKIRKERKEIQFLDAEVKKDNIASRKKFEQLGYRSCEIIRYRKSLKEQNNEKLLKGRGNLRKEIN